MFDLRAVIIGTAAAVVAAAAPATGQTPADLRAQLERLRQEHTTALAAARRADSARVAGVGVDTIRVGALTVIAPQSTGSPARPATAEAWRMLHERIGEEARALGGIEFVIQQAGTPDIVPRAPSRLVRPLAVPRGTTTTELAKWLARRAAMEIAALQDTSFRRWLRSGIDLFSDSTRWSASAYVELVTQPWTAVKRCYLGDLDGCRHALGLAPGIDLLDQWYDAEDRRRLVAAADEGQFNRAHARERTACVDGGAADACTALLRDVSASYLQPPLPSGPLALVGLVLDLGGPGAYTRLMASPERPLAERLSAAAGLAPDSLLATWRARVLAARPEPVTLTAALAWAAFAWVLAFGTLAVQSTRWR